MEHKELGQTGVRLPEIGLGTWEYEGGVEPLRRGVDSGAFLIDTAEGYATEEIVGLAIKNIRECVFLVTKVSPQHLRRSDLLQAADRSLQRMRTDHIDLYQLHYPNYAVPIGETMAAMEELVDMGKVRFIGVSNFSVADLKRAQANLTKSRIVSNQVRYNLVDRSIDWCISKEAVIAIPKANSLEHTVENCHASGWRLSRDQIRLLEEGIKSRGRIEATLRQAARCVRNRFFWN